MPTPQQPEIVPVEPPDGGPGPVPEENLPGHHPEHDQDKPEGPPPTPGVRPPKATKAAKKRKAAAPKPKEAAVSPDPAAEGTRRFHFAFEPFMLPFAIPFGVTPMTAWVEVDGRELRVRFGPWSARTSRDNITGAAVTGPYSFPKVAGPAHLSFADGGATFATTTKRGVCLEFREPIPALVPLGLLRHSGLTVTVDDPEGLVTALGF
jgi:hypothetical protein